MNREEHNLQMACVRWFRTTYPAYAKRLFSIPNGGYRNKATAIEMKAEGMVKGVPDLFLAVPQLFYGGLFIEMKTAKGRLSDEQKEMIALLKDGFRVVVCRNIEEFQNCIKDYLGYDGRGI